MHPVAHFAHSLKRLFTTCRVFSGSFTGKACIQRAIRVNTVHYTTHVRTSWCMRERLGEGLVSECLGCKIPLNARHQGISTALECLELALGSPTQLLHYLAVKTSQGKGKKKQIKGDLPATFSFSTFCIL